MSSGAVKTPHEPSPSRRVDRLQADLRRWRSLATLLAALVLGVGAAHCSTLPYLSARGPRGGVSVHVAAAGLVVEAAGIGRAILGESAGGLGLTVFDSAGARRATIGLQSDGNPRLGLFDSEGTRRLGAELSVDGHPQVVLSDAAGTQRMVIALDPLGNAGLGIFDAPGTRRAGIGAGIDGAVGVALFTGEGSQRLLLNVEPEGSPGLTLYGDDGQARIVLDVGPDDRPRLHVDEQPGAAAPDERDEPEHKVPDTPA